MKKTSLYLFTCIIFSFIFSLSIFSENTPFVGKWMAKKSNGTKIIFSLRPGGVFYKTIISKSASGRLRINRRAGVGKWNLYLKYILLSYSASSKKELLYINVKTSNNITLTMGNLTFNKVK